MNNIVNNVCNNTTAVIGKIQTKREERAYSQQGVDTYYLMQVALMTWIVIFNLDFISIEMSISD